MVFLLAFLFMSFFGVKQYSVFHHIFTEESLKFHNTSFCCANHLYQNYYKSKDLYSKLALFLMSKPNFSSKIPIPSQEKLL